MIKALDLSHSYNSAEVLSGITFSMKRGDYVGLVGPNGSGKSTLIKLILGLEPPSRGSVEVFGRGHKDLTDWNRIGYLPQKINFFNPHFPSTVREVAALGLISAKGPARTPGGKRAAVDHALELLNIADIGDRLIGDLSGGQQQRVFIARALVSGPELLILDEPATALDPETRDNFFSLLSELNKQKNVSIILVTHDIGSMGKFASKLMYLDKKIIFYGSFDEFCRSDTMTQIFGPSSQHIICHKHG